jgi:3-oxoacyl-[acyl-carrier protein] reductase
VIKKALVIGACHGNLGEAIAEQLIDWNYVHRADIQQGGKFPFHRVDVTNPKEVYDLIRNLHPIDVIVYSAGVNNMGALTEYDSTEFQRHLDVNLMGAFHTIKAYVNIFEKYKSTKSDWYSSQRKIIIVTSNTAFIPRTRSVAYCVSKAAVNMLVQQAHRELAQDGYKIIGFAPGVIEDTYMHRKTHEELYKLRGWNEEKCTEIRTSLIPMRRFTNTIECAKVVRFLATREGDYFGGEIVRFGGGEK